MILFNEQAKTFHLKTAKTSYVMKVLESGHLIHLYWGKSLHTNNLDYAVRRRDFFSFVANTDNIQEFHLEALAQEYPGYGSTDLRSPAIELVYGDGTSATDFRYLSHKITAGKPKLEGLPATYVESDDEAQTLEITLLDKVKNVEVVLSYSVFDKFDAIARSVKVVNKSDDTIKIQRVLSANVDFKDGNFEMIQLSGSWARERHIIRTPLRSGGQCVESRRGASSHAQNPFMALVRPETTENTGDAYAVSLIYSGNFLANTEVDMYNNSRLQIGINPFDFTWQLKAGESFQAPEAVLVYSGEGLTGMSHIYQNFYGKRLMRGYWRDKVRPVLINNWEATYFDFDEVKIKAIAKQASEFGIELFVLDDGWFGERNNDDRSLGDWVVNENKIHGGLKKLVDEVNAMGLKFGLWFEPEMVCPISKLYEAHPDWCLHIEGRTRSTARRQLILDLSRKEVCDYVIESVSSVLSSANIEYVKWDMNRNMTEIGSATLPPENQREVAHRYMLGLYRIMDEITSRFPKILFESCSGGGGRFDPGILYYMPQTWTSDDTDAMERLAIQYGTSMVYPSVSMGCHVSAVPNHQVHRITPFATRGICAMCGNFGYELDLTKLTETEKMQAKSQVAFYKEVRELIQFGDFYRLQSPFGSNTCAWSFVAKDKSEAIVSFFRKMAEPNCAFATVYATGLDADAKYKDMRTGEVYGGDELMQVGINVPYAITSAPKATDDAKDMYAGMITDAIQGDYGAFIWHFKKVD